MDTHDLIAEGHRKFVEAAAIAGGLRRKSYILPEHIEVITDLERRVDELKNYDVALADLEATC